MGSSKVLIRLALGTTIVRTTPEKTPCRDPVFTDQLTFNVCTWEGGKKRFQKGALGFFCLGFNLRFVSFYPPFSLAHVSLLTPPSPPLPQIDDKVVGTSLDLAIIESQSVGPSKFLGTASIDLSTFTRRPGKTEADWPIHMKGKVVNVHVRAFFSPLRTTGSNVVS